MTKDAGTGLEQACPPFQQKYTAIWQKHTANSYKKKSDTFPLFHIIFLISTFETKT
jgi:hypothetical protein